MEKYERKYKKALEHAKQELKSCSSQDCDVAKQIFRIFPELKEKLKESEDEKIRKEIISYLRGCYGAGSKEYLISKRKLWIAWFEKQGSQNLANSTKNLEGEHKPTDNNKHDDKGIINGIIDFVTNPTLLLPSRKQEYITFLKSMKENVRRINFFRKVKSEKQVILITESNGNANIDWDTSSLEDVRKLLECGLQYINTELEKNVNKNLLIRLNVGLRLVIGSSIKKLVW